MGFMHSDIDAEKGTSGIKSIKSPAGSKQIRDGT